MSRRLGALFSRPFVETLVSVRREKPENAASAVLAVLPLVEGEQAMAAAR